MNAQIHPSFAELTTPLVPPDVLAGFEALANGRCSLAELSDTVLTACSADPGATEGVLQLLESSEDSEVFERFDFGPLKHALEGGQEESEESSTQDSVERDDQYDEMPVLTPIDEPRMLRGRYVLEAEIGRGGVGAVYRALDINRTGLPPGHHHVALKILGESAARRPDAVDALRREFHQAQSLSHPGIVNVFDFDHDSDTHFVTMELLDGESLGELTRRLFPNKLPPETAARILRELGDAIVYAHDRGVLHLDLKPDNVMIDADGRVRVLDFGIAQTQMPERDIPQLGSAPPAATPAYASCERLMQERPDVRDDLFSFSCMVYELLAGTHPFDRCSALKARKDGRKPRRIRSLSRRQWAALERGLAWAREDRPANMRALLRGLALHSSPPPEAATQRVAWQRAAAVALIGLVAAAILSWGAVQHRTRSLGQRSATTVAAERASARESADTDRRTPEVIAAAIVPSDPEFEAAAPATSAPAPQIEPAAAVVTPVSAIDAQVESAVLDAEPMPPKPRADTTSETLVAASRPTAEASDELGFSRHSFSVSEADSAVHVNVRRRGGAAGDIAFQWYTVDDSARAGQDYIYGFGEVRMAPGQTTATFDVPIVEDTIREDPELLQVIIGSSRGAHVGAAGRAPVIIVDDD